MRYIITLQDRADPPAILGFSAWRAHRLSLGSNVQTVDMRVALPATMLGTAQLQIWLRT